MRRETREAISISRLHIDGISKSYEYFKALSRAISYISRRRDRPAAAAKNARRYYRRPLITRTPPCQDIPRRPIALLRTPISGRLARTKKFLSNAPPPLPPSIPSSTCGAFAAMPTTNRDPFPGEYHRPSSPPHATYVSICRTQRTIRSNSPAKRAHSLRVLIRKC